LNHRWLILADDLSGAADAGVAFAARGLCTEVRWDDADAPSADRLDVIAFDTDSRRLDALAAAERQRAAARALWKRGMALYKKVDSTLRGQPAAEIAALAACTQCTRVIFAPANPAMGRTTREGRVWVRGRPLEDSETWRRDHTYESSDLGEALGGAGLDVVKLPLEVVRDPPALAKALRVPRPLVCDAETDADLAAIAAAAAALPDAHGTLFAGTAGLAQALAARHPWRRFAPLDLRPTRAGVLLVVGSLASVSRQAAAQVAELPGVRAVGITSRALLDPDACQRMHLGSVVAAAIAVGEDVVVEIEPETSPDLAQGPQLARALAQCLEPARHQLGGLVVTGGETASALLAGWYFHGIRLIEEVAPGISLGIAVGEGCVPLVTKPGGFGDASSLALALEALRRFKQRTVSA